MKDELFNIKIKLAKINSALTAIVPSSVALIISIIFPFFKGEFIPSAIFSFILTVVMFGLFYLWIFHFWFGKEIIKKLKSEEQTAGEVLYNFPQENLTTDMANAINGFGPARIGFIVSENLLDD